MSNKKSFKTNPAEAFISPSNNEFNDTIHARENEAETLKQQYAYTIEPIKAEAKTKRVQLLVKPSLYNHIKEEADRQGSSFNDFVHRLLIKGMREYL